VITILRDVKPCSSVNVHRRFGGTYCLHIEYRTALAGCFDPEDGYKTTVRSLSEMRQCTWRHVPKDNNAHTYHCDSLKANTKLHLKIEPLFYRKNTRTFPRSYKDRLVNAVYRNNLVYSEHHTTTAVP
jgi:hypothetical protein